MTEVQPAGGSKWKPEYGETRRLKREAHRQAEKLERAIKDLRKAHQVVASMLGDDGKTLILFGRQTEEVRVSSPTVPKAVDIVRRPEDSIEKLLRSGRLGKAEYRVALAYRAAWDIVNGCVGGVMDFDRVRGGGSPGGGLSMAELHAAETLRFIQKDLSREDIEMFEMIIGHGLSVREYTTMKYDADPKTRECTPEDRVYVERCLIEALEGAASARYPAYTEREQPPIRAQRADGSLVEEPARKNRPQAGRNQS